MPGLDRLYHYTNAKGFHGILAERVLNASTRENHPADARHGDADIRPRAMTPAQLSRRLVGHPFSGNRYTHYLLIDVKGLDVHEVRDHVFLIPGVEPLDLSERIVEYGNWDYSRSASS